MEYARIAIDLGVTSLTPSPSERGWVEGGISVSRHLLYAGMVVAIGIVG